MEHQQKQAGITVFYSYASANKEWRDQLAIHLSQLRRSGLIEEWSDQQILPGSDRAQVIDQALHSAHMILLLISADFLASDTCYQENMQHALERHQRGEARVIPIIVRPCDWQSSPFAHLQCLPRNGQPIATWSNPDDAFVDIVAGIRQVIEDLVLLPVRFPLLVLPSVWTIPFRRNPLFIGREQILTDLHEKFASHKSGAVTQPQAISGLGGIGKTQTAIEYAYRYRDDYRIVLWVRADTSETLASDFVTIANHLKLAERNAQNQHLIVNAVKSWLEASPNWLLILDNADDLTIIQDFLPTTGKGHVLLTTRARPMGTLAQRVEMEKMKMEEGILFLLRRADIIAPDASLEAASPADRAHAHELVTLLDSLPLALDQAGAYIEETGTDISHYLKLYKTRRKALLKRRSKLPTDHPEPVASTWSLSFQRTEKLNPIAADLLRFCAFLQPDAIPQELITEGALELGNMLEAIASDPLQLDEAIGDLLRFSLVRRHLESKTLSVHRLVQVVLKDEMDEQTQRSWAERIIRAINRAFPKGGGAKMWPDYQRYLPQALACAELIEQWNIVLPEAARLLHRAGFHLYDRLQYEEAEMLLKQAVIVYEQALGSEHSETAKCLFSLAWVYTNHGKDEEAEPLFQQSLTIREQALGPDHLDTVQSLNDLALLYVEQGKYKQAEPMIKRALAIRERDLGPKHPRLAEMLANLARLYMDSGHYEQAEQLIKRALTLLEPEWEEDRDGQYKANMLHRVANLYMQRGKHDQAEPIVKQVLTIMETVQELDPCTATALQYLADIYITQNKYEQAEQLYLRALKIWKQITGRENIFSYRKLARIYMKQGKYEQAEQLYQQALDAWEQRLTSAPNDTEGYLDRGYVYLYLKKSEYACADFAKYAVLRPKDVNAAWIVIYAALGRQHPGVEGAERLETIAMLDPESAGACTCRGVALGLRGKLQEGLAELEHALYIEPKNEDTLFWKGMMCAYLGRNTVAMESIEQALQGGLPPILLIPLYWLEQNNPIFYREYAKPLLGRAPLNG